MQVSMLMTRLLSAWHATGGGWHTTGGGLGVWLAGWRGNRAGQSCLLQGPFGHNLYKILELLVVLLLRPQSLRMGALPSTPLLAFAAFTCVATNVVLSKVRASSFYAFYGQLLLSDVLSTTGLIFTLSLTLILVLILILILSLAACPACPTCPHIPPRIGRIGRSGPACWAPRATTLASIEWCKTRWAKSSPGAST